MFPYCTANTYSWQQCWKSSLHLKETAVDKSSLTDCQKVIEEVKSKIPVHHSRAMHKVMFSMFGRVKASLKPAAARHIYRLFTAYTGVHDLTWKYN